MSIDREVNSVVNAYMGNEAALQKKYAMEQQLIDLLALQKLKSDREAAAKEMQMKAQVPPATVAGQLENENLQAIKQQIVGDMPQEGILAAAQGGMVRGFAEGGEIDLNEAEQNLPSDQTVDADPDEVEKLLDSSYEEGTVENPDTGEEVTKVGGGIANWAMDNPVDAISLGLMFIPGVGWGAAAGLKGLGLAYKGLKGIDYLSKGKNIGQGIVKGSKGLGNLVKKGFTTPGKVTPQNPLKRGPGGRFLKPSRQFSLRRTALLGGPLTGGALRGIDYFYENGFSDEDIKEAIANGQLTQESGTGATGTGATGTGATTEPPMSAYDKIMEEFGATREDLLANLNAEKRIQEEKDILAKEAENKKPKERSYSDVASDFLAGAAAGGLGGGGNALRQAAINIGITDEEYQTTLVDNAKQIADLTQELGDKEMAINLAAATNKYARDMAAKALAIENARDQRDFAYQAQKDIKEAISNNFIVMKRLEEGDQQGAIKIANDLRAVLMQSSEYQKLIALANNAAGSSSGLVYGAPYMNNV
jgi:hypothetical protein